MDTPRHRLYLIDGYSNIFRAFYAIRNLSNSRGRADQRGLRLRADAAQAPARREARAHRGRPRRRGHRKEACAPSVTRSTRPTATPCRRICGARSPGYGRPSPPIAIPILELDRYEADDVLGTLAKKAAAAGYDVVLVSADKDLMQLVGPHVSLYHTGRNKLYGPARVTEDFGVPPEKVADVLALMGDAIDNIPGVPGSARRGEGLIQEYGSLADLLARAAR